MLVQIVVGSRHGATTEIAESIASRLGERGLDVNVSEPTQASLEGCDAAIIGSAVYAGSWVKETRRFVDDNEDALSKLPVWLFSSGPLDDPHGAALSEKKVETLTDATRARDHHVFAGRLDHSVLGLAERLIAKAVHAPDGDFREWDDIAAWSDEIADSLLENDRT